MNYRKICSIKKFCVLKNEYVGIASPKIFEQWKEIDLFIFLFEAINQFAVKSVRRMLGLKIFEDGGVELDDLYLPSQIKDVELIKEPNYDNFTLEGSIMLFEALFKVHFVAYYDKCNGEKEMIAKGLVYVSKINIT